MTLRLWLPLLAASLFLFPAAHAQARAFLSNWQARAVSTQLSQPRWATALLTTTPLLDQSLRADFQHSTQAAGAALWNLGAGKGLKLIVAPRLEIDLNMAPYLIHQPSHSTDGFGDISFTAKYRLFARTASHGNAVVTAFFGGAYPTGAHSNGARNATVTPTLAAGKGFGLFVVESTLGATLPTQGTGTAGRPIAWNSAALFHAQQHLWFQLESNATFYQGGPNDGRTQQYLTPGVIARFRNSSRTGPTFAAGMQFATTHTHAGDHILVLSTRLHF